MIHFTTISILLVVLVTYCLRTGFRADINAVPGPFLAKFTNLWRLYWTWRRAIRHHVTRLHIYYKSPYVRLGPRVICCNDPAAVETIFGFRTQMNKPASPAPTVSLFQRQQMPSIFAAVTPEEHKSLRAPIAGAFTATKVLKFEKTIDSAISRFFSKLEILFGGPNTICDLHNWIHYFTTDLIFELTLGEAIGLVEAGTDVDGVLATKAGEMDFRGLVLAMPLLGRISHYLSLIRALFWPPKAPEILSRVRRLLNTAKSNPTHGGSPNSTACAFIQDYVNAAQKDQRIDDRHLLAYIQQSLSVGPDTTSIVLRTAVYCSLKSPSILEAILEELSMNDGKAAQSYAAIRSQLPFCNAVVRESLRWHFPFVNLMEREVPQGQKLVLPGGLVLLPGTVVGVQPGAIQRNKVIFGEDADVFNPRRWLKHPGESQEAFEDRLTRMAAAELTFGYGPRACLGRTVAEMILYKFIPTFFSHFAVTLVRPNEPWTIRSLFVDKQSGIDVFLARRDEKRES